MKSPKPLRLRVVAGHARAGFVEEPVVADLGERDQDLAGILEPVRHRGFVGLELLGNVREGQLRDAALGNQLPCDAYDDRPNSTLGRVCSAIACLGKGRQLERRAQESPADGHTCVEHVVGADRRVAEGRLERHRVDQRGDRDRDRRVSGTENSPPRPRPRTISSITSRKRSSSSMPKRAGALVAQSEAPELDPERPVVVGHARLEKGEHPLARALRGRVSNATPSNRSSSLRMTCAERLPLALELCLRRRPAPPRPARPAPPAPSRRRPRRGSAASAASRSAVRSGDVSSAFIAICSFSARRLFALSRRRPPLQRYFRTRISFLFTNSSMPYLPSSRPKPEFLTPPNGNSAPSSRTPLT